MKNLFFDSWRFLCKGTDLTAFPSWLGIPSCALTGTCCAWWTSSGQVRAGAATTWCGMWWRLWSSLLACSGHRSGVGVSSSSAVGSVSSCRSSAGRSVGEPGGVDGSVATRTCSVGARIWSVRRVVAAGGPIGDPGGGVMARA